MREDRVQLYTFDLIHENLGFKLFWGGVVVYGWMFILPLWGMAAYPEPGFSTAWTYVWLIGTAALFLRGWSISRRANLQKYTFKRCSDRKFLGLIEPSTLRPVTVRSCTAVYGVSPATSTTWARGSFPCRLPWHSATLLISGPGPILSSSSRCSPSVNVMTTRSVPRNTAPKNVLSTRRG